MKQEVLNVYHFFPERQFKEKWQREEHERMYAGVINLMKLRDANLAKRGIDASSPEEQLAAIEERGRQLLERYKDELREKRRSGDKMEVNSEMRVGKTCLHCLFL